MEKEEKHLFLFLGNCLFCRLCGNFLEIKNISCISKSINILYRCKCSNKYHFNSLNKFLKFFNYSFKDLTIRNNTFNYLEKDTWKKYIINNNYFIDISNEKEYNCNCINSKRLYYCIDCQKFICNECINIHNYHRLFNYEQNIHMSDTNIHKLEKYCYNSYKKLKQCNATAKSKIKELMKNDKIFNDIEDYLRYYNEIKDIDMIDEYIKYNNEINESLFKLFQLLINTFKISRTLQNYLNLSHFAYFNIPIQFDLFEIQKYKKELKINIIQLFIHYCQSNFLIPVQSNKKHFTFIKEFAFLIRLKVIIPGLQKKDKVHEPRKYYLRVGEKYEKSEMTIVSRRKMKERHLLIEELLILKNQQLIIKFKDLLTIYALKFDSKKNVLTFNYTITNYRIKSIKHIIKYLDSVIFVLDYYESLFVIAIKEKNFSIIAHYNEVQWSVVLKDQSVLMLKIHELSFIKNVAERSPQIVIDEDLYGYSFGYDLSNSLILIHKKFIVKFIRIPENKTQRVEIIATFLNSLFTNLITCSENVHTQRLFCQTKTHVIIFDLKMNRIQSIYGTISFLYYPLDHKNDELMDSLFNSCNYDNKILSKSMLFGKTREIFQLSLHTFLINTSNTCYWYTLN